MTANAIDLTTVAAVNAYLGLASGPTDALIQSLITSASSVIANVCGRQSFAPALYSETYDGWGKEWLLLRQWPVTAIGSVAVDGQPVWAASGGGVSFGSVTVDGSPVSPPVVVGAAAVQAAANGWMLEPSLPGSGAQRLTLFGSVFTRGRSNVQISYTAGYSPIPYDLAQACNELVGEAFNRRTRLGQVSKTLAGQETVSFSQKDMGAAISSAIQPYKRVVPFF